jgi:cleavage and polyadenylation specificity factor subunit 2
VFVRCSQLIIIYFVLIQFCKANSLGLRLDFIKELKKYVHTIDAVLISYPDSYHIGALPYLVGKLGLNCPIYATIPVFKMGQMFMYDLFISHYNMYNFDLFTLDDVDAAFEKITQLKYNQSVAMKGLRNYNYTAAGGPQSGGLVAQSGRLLKLVKRILCMLWTLITKKERHLNGCELEKMQRPSLLITDSYNAKYQ